MKKCYKVPEIEVVDLDLEGICQIASPGGTNPTPGKDGDGEGNEDDNADAASYRSSLWN